MVDFLYFKCKGIYICSEQLYCVNKRYAHICHSVVNKMIQSIVSDILSFEPASEVDLQYLKIPNPILEILPIDYFIVEAKISYSFNNIINYRTVNLLNCLYHINELMFKLSNEEYVFLIRTWQQYKQTKNLHKLKPLRALESTDFLNTRKIINVLT